jgi:hypothetical protein
MNVGLSTLYDIGSNYTIPLNDKEVLVVEKDETRVKKRTDAQKPDKQLQEEKEKKLSADELSPEDKELVKKLQARDAQVKAHEAAHQAAGAGLTGAASFTYQQGPDGKMYAIGGEVSITMKTGSTPEETIANARQVAAAAMAAGDPSPQDYAVASSARVMEMKAQQQLAKERQEEVLGTEIYKNESNQNNKDVKNPLDISA